MSMMTEWACFYAAIGVPQSKIGSATAVSFLKVRKILISFSALIREMLGLVDQRVPKHPSYWLD